METLTADRRAETACAPFGHRRALLLVNPQSRRGRESLDHVVQRLQKAGISVEREAFSCPTEVSPDILRRRDEVDCVLVCGGDGTLNSAAKGMIETGLPMGIIPIGTANDLARTLGIPTNLEQAVDVIIAGQCRAIDVGEVNGHPFFNVASIGVSAELAKGLTSETKRRWGKLGYAIAALKVLVRARPFRAMIVSKDTTARVRTLQIAVGNGRHYGGGMTVEENASIFDRHLDLYSLEMGSVWKLALMGGSFREGSHGAWKEVRTIRCTEFDIRTRKPRPINLDGELVAFTPARFTIRPGAISVYTPAWH